MTTTNANDDKGVAASSARLPPSIYTAGSGTATYKPEGLITQSVTSAGTPASTVETTLWTYTLPAGTLATNGDRLFIRAQGSFAANGNTKTLKFKFGTTSYTLNNVTTAPNGVAWHADITLARTSATVQIITANSIIGAAPQTYNGTSGAETLAGAIVISITGTNGTASANDIVFSLGSVEYRPI